jgi:hypothetical protein
MFKDKEDYNQLQTEQLLQVHLVVVEKVYKEHFTNLNQIETEQHYKHSFYNKDLLKDNN